MSTIANITWSFVPGSLSTLVEYKLHSSSTWITPTSPNNPTTNNTYPIIIQDNLVYDVRLTTNGIRCSPRSTTLQVLHTANNCCPPGYSLSTDGTFCQQVNTTSATPPSAPENTIAKNSVSYGVFGTVIYDPGYDVDGTGNFTLISYSNSFWVNGDGSGGGANTTNGAPNRTGLWSTTTSDNQDVGFAVCITAAVTGTYYVGCMGDNRVSIFLDGNTIVSMNVPSMIAFFSSHGFPGIDAQVTFRFWHVYPVMLSAGDHVLEVIGHNDTGVAAMGTEIYLLTSSQIQAAASYSDIGSGLIFSTKDFIGQPVQVGSGGIGYSCPSGYSLVLCEGPAFCRQILTTSTIPCVTTTTTTTTSTSTTTTTTHTTTTTSTTTTTTTT